MPLNENPEDREAMRKLKEGAAKAKEAMHQQRMFPQHDKRETPPDLEQNNPQDGDDSRARVSKRSRSGRPKGAKNKSKLGGRITR